MRCSASRRSTTAGDRSQPGEAKLRTGREQNATKYPVEIPELPPGRIDRITSLLKPYLRILQPKLYGVENLPAGGSLLVGNHRLRLPGPAVHDGRDLEAPSARRPRPRRARALRVPDLARLPRRGRDGPRHTGQHPGPDARPTDNPGLPPMQSPDRYLVPDDRDFFAVYLPLPGPVTVPFH
jgi:hypothetical protein